MMLFNHHLRALTVIAFACLGNVYGLGAVPDNGPYDLIGVLVQESPKIDGIITDNEYPAAARREGFTDLDTNISSDEKAEFWLTYDEQFIYFAGRVKTDPRRVVRQEYRPNSSVGGNDNFSLLIDPFGSNNNFNRFSANSNGATEIYLSGGRAAKTEWLGEIESNGRTTETGWECEMRIPWWVMNLPSSGRRTLNFNIRWYRSNKQNTYVYRYINNDESLTPKWVDVTVPAISKARTLSLLPYAFGGVQKGSGPIANAGLDLKTSLTDTIQFVGTINPDFRNVENSILSLDPSYFERLPGENRPFFQEGADYTRTGYSTRLFASQRIPYFDAGFNVYGELNSTTTFGALTTVDFGEQQASVIKLSKKLNSYDNFEVGYVNNDQRGLNNQSGMLNYFTQKGEFNYYLTNQFAVDQQQGSGWRNNIGGGYESANIYIGAEYLSITPDFFPRIGFNRDRNLKGYSLYANNSVTPVAGPLNSYEFGVNAETYDRFTGGFYRNNIGLNAELSTRSGIAFGVGQSFNNFEGTPDRSFGIGAKYPTFDPYHNASLNYSTGTFRGIPFEQYQVNWTYRVLSRMQLNSSSEFFLSDDDETQHILGLNYDLSKYESIGGRLVYRNGESNWYLSYRMSGKKGTEYFILIGDPRADTFTDRIVFKAVVPLSIRF
jgi:hypothetical protein